MLFGKQLKNDYTDDDAKLTPEQELKISEQIKNKNINLIQERIKRG